MISFIVLFDFLVEIPTYPGSSFSSLLFEVCLAIFSVEIEYVLLSISCFVELGIFCLC